MVYHIYMNTKTIVLPKTNTHTLEYSLLTLSFFIPFLISGPQLLTGSVVNALLFLFVSKTYSKKFLPIIVLPSLGALLNGVVFGTFTPFLLYFLPFIWISNFILVESFQYCFHKKSFAMGVVGSSIIKSLFLFTIAFVFTTTKFVPQIFLQAMGIFQLGTALLGGAIAFGISNINSKKV